MSRKKIVLIGGGSYGWIPKIAKDMMLTEAISDSEFVLYDINKEAADLVAAFLSRLNEKLQTGAVVVPTDDKKTAFSGADYFVITISTGGLDAMAHDLAIPEEYGIYHTVGDTSGPGGWARTIRNFKVFEGLAADFAVYGNGAPVLNYTNPMTTLTDVLSRLYDGPVIGLCHGLFENVAKLAAIYRIENPEEIALKYAGLNHFFWITEARRGEIDIFSDLRKRVVEEGLTKILEKADDGKRNAAAPRELASALFSETGVMPYFGDRHTCEFFPCYITSRDAMEKYKIVRTTIDERRKGLKKRKTELETLLTDEIPSEYLTRSRETAADIISAHATGGAFIDVGNVPNVGQISNLPDGIVVETAVRVDRNGFSPICFGPLPESVLGFVEPYARAFTRTVDACMQRDKQMAVQALRMDPVCSHLTGERVAELGERLLNAHRQFIPELE